MASEKKKKLLEKASILAAAIETSSTALIAKKDFEIWHNDYHRKITAGEDISDVPELYHENLKTEGVL